MRSDQENVFENLVLIIVTSEVVVEELYVFRNFRYQLFLLRNFLFWKFEHLIFEISIKN